MFSFYYFISFILFVVEVIVVDMIIIVVLVVVIVVFVVIINKLGQHYRYSCVKDLSNCVENLKIFVEIWKKECLKLEKKVEKKRNTF